MRLLPTLLLTTLLLALGCHTLPAQHLRPASDDSPTTQPTRSRIVISEDRSLIDRFSVAPEQVRAAFNRDLLAFTRKPDIASAWQTMVSAEDVVGIKINTQGGPIMATRRALLMAVIDGLTAAGVPRQNIIVWDKFQYHMIAAGYVPMSPKKGWQCRAVILGAGFDRSSFYFHELAGQLIWGDLEFVGKIQADRDRSNIETLARAAAASARDPFTGRAIQPQVPANEEAATPPQLSNRSHFTSILTRDTTKLINIATLSDHDRLGINGALASLAIGSVDNTRRFMNSTEPAATAIAEIMLRQEIASRTVLHIIDGLIAQYAGGPEFFPHYAESAGILMISNDPVALDTLALERIEDWRRLKGVLPVGDTALHVATAAAYGIGTNRRDRMQIITTD